MRGALIGLVTLHCHLAEVQGAPDPLCATGIQSGNVCCRGTCGVCDGEQGCSARDGGANHCCAGKIVQNGITCSEAGPGCIRVFADPDCSTGIPNRGICCHASCPECYTGSSCGTDAKCCESEIRDNGVPCALAGPPCIMSGAQPATAGPVSGPDPTCATGIVFQGDVCCRASCTRCDGAVGCSNRNGGSNHCCAGRIRQNAFPCSTTEPGCVIIPPDPDCSNGKRGAAAGDICCPLSCSVCTGSGCSAGGTARCCESGIRANGVSCDVAGAPCVISTAAPTAPTAAPTRSPLPGGWRTVYEQGCLGQGACSDHVRDHAFAHNALPSGSSLADCFEECDRYHNCKAVSFSGRPDGSSCSLFDATGCPYDASCLTGVSQILIPTLSYSERTVFHRTRYPTFDCCTRLNVQGEVLVRHRRVQSDGSTFYWWQPDAGFYESYLHTRHPANVGFARHASVQSHSGDVRVFFPPSSVAPGGYLYSADLYFLGEDHCLGSGLNMSIECAGTPHCAVYAFVYHQPPFTFNTSGGLPQSLVNAGWQARSRCAPRFGESAGDCPMLGLRYNLAEGESVLIEQAPNTDLQYFFVAVVARRNCLDNTLNETECNAVHPGLATTCVWNSNTGMCEEDWCPPRLDAAGTPGGAGGRGGPTQCPVNLDCSGRTSSPNAGI